MICEILMRISSKKKKVESSNDIKANLCRVSRH